MAAFRLQLVTTVGSASRDSAPKPQFLTVCAQSKLLNALPLDSAVDFHHQPL